MRDVLPQEHRTAHELAFTLHDVILEAYVSGLHHDLFSLEVAFRDEKDRRSFDEAADA